jgi:hypothetical protein
MQQSYSDGIALILTNLALIPAIVLAIVYRLFPEVVVMTVLMFTSSMYHICQSGFYCIYLFDSLQVSDHFYVYSTLIWMTFWFVGLKLKFRFILFFIIQSALLPAIISYLHSWLLTGILIAALVVIVLLILSISFENFPKLDWLDVLVVIGLLGGGFYLHVYAGEPGSQTYPVAHSIWHVLSMISLFFVIEIKEGSSFVAKAIRRFRRNVRKLYENNGFYKHKKTKLKSRMKSKNYDFIELGLNSYNFKINGKQVI